jgi:hypothetical protein
MQLQWNLLRIGLNGVVLKVLLLDRTSRRVEPVRVSLKGSVPEIEIVVRKSSQGLRFLFTIHSQHLQRRYLGRSLPWLFRHECSYE